MHQSPKTYLIFVPLIGLCSGALLWAGSLQPQIKHNSKTSIEALEKTDMILKEVRDLSVNVGTLSAEVKNLKESMNKMETLLMGEVLK